MKNRRRCIAVILSDMCEKYQTALIEGIRKRAYELNYNVAVFASFFKSRADSPLNEMGETNIFSLINFELFEGFIVVPNSIEIPEIFDGLVKSLKESGKPVVFIDKESDDFYSVCCDDYSSFKNITNHLIKDHGFRRINCLTGYKELNLSEIRLNGYIDALIENNIQVEEKRYDYGDFWKIAPVKFVDDMLSCGLELPQAVVCANDTMAITVCETLKERGIKVPEDIAVIGYDRTIDGKIFSPQISSVEPSIDEMGVKAVDLIINAAAGKNVEKTSYIAGKFYPSESCGCLPSLKDSTEADLDAIHNYTKLSQYFVNSIYMSENLQESASVDILFNTLAKYLYLLMDIAKTLHIYLCENWDVLHEREYTDTPVLFGYSDKMISHFTYDNGIGFKNTETFSTAEMFPPIFDDSLPADTYFFLPINFQDITFGYTVCTCFDNVAAPDVIFRSWIKYLSNALEHLRSNQHLKWALKRLERMSERDALTGVYNRHGYDNRIGPVFDAAKIESKDFLVIMGDLDCLKSINDNFGHSEGDNAIKTIARALQNSFKEDEICARIGGDEFIMFGSGYFSEEELNNYCKRINDYLKHYNSNSSKPYIVGISLGMYCHKVSKDSELKDWLDKADENMYANKKSKVKVFLKDKA